MRILGIDPGSTATGYGVVESESSALRHVAHGTLRSPRRLPVAQRLHSLLDQIQEIVAQHRPDAAVVEQVFVAASPRSALILGQARGAVLAGLGGGLPVHEYAASRIKQAVTGSGRADKRQVQSMVRRLLALDQLPQFDAADALAAAICHAHSSRLGTLVAAAAPRRRRRAPRGVRVGVRRSP